MKNKYFLSFLFFFWLSVSFAQEHSPIIDKILKGDPNLVLFKRQDKSKFIVAAAVNKTTRVLYMLDRYAAAWDSIRIPASSRDEIIHYRYDPFTLYMLARKRAIAYNNDIIKQLRYDGKLDTQSPYYPIILSEHPDFINVDSTSRMKDIITMEKESRADSITLWVLEAKDPKHPAPGTAYDFYSNDLAGIKNIIGDTVEYMNKDGLSPFYIAIIEQKTGRIFYNNNMGQRVKEFKVDPKLIPGLVNIDLFQYYHNWLEVSKQNIVHQIRLLDEPGQSNIYFASLGKTNKKYSALRQQEKEIDEQLDRDIYVDIKSLTSQFQHKYRYANYYGPWLDYLNIPYHNESYELQISDEQWGTVRKHRL
jgi:hypothetical protein